MPQVLYYDPNIRFATQTVRVTFGTWDYRTSKNSKVNGNCKGFNIMEGIIEDIYEKLPNCKSEDGEKFILLKNQEESLERTLESEDDLKDLVLKIEIIKIEPEKPKKKKIEEKE